MKKFHTYLRHIVLVILMACASAVNAQIDAEQVLTIGKNVLSMEDYMLAIQYFNQAIKAKPYLSEPYFFRALAKLELEDYQGAIEDATLSIEKNKFRTEAYKLRGFAAQCIGRDSLAIIDYNIGLNHNPTDRYFLFYKAIAQTEINDTAGAHESFKTLLRHYPNFEEGYAARGRLYLQQGDTIAALQDINKSLEISKSLINSYLMLADVQSRRHEWEEARKSMDEAIKLKPQEPSLYVNRAFIRYNTDDYFGAMADYNYSLDLNPDYTPALFNRALLRYEVKDLQASEADLSHVLRLDPSNFHALYNRGLVYLELEKPKAAIADFQAIAKRYPRFYPVYYALAQANQEAGNMREAAVNYRKAEELVTKYVANPEKNPLDRPAIAADTSNSSGADAHEGESDIDVMNRFNQLVTVNDAQEPQLAFNDKIKGKVQDRNIRVEPEAMYALTLTDNPDELRQVFNWFRELDDLNRRRYLSSAIYLSNSTATPDSQQELEQLFSSVDNYTATIANGSQRPVDFLGRAVTYTALKNFENALQDFDKALELDPKFTVALMGRAYVLAHMAMIPSHENGNAEEAAMQRKLTNTRLQAAVNDLDAALRLNPRLIYAWFNKGDIYYALQDYTAAIQCFNEALRLNPDFGQALYNRGLCYLQTGNKFAAFADLSKAGELGILPSYSLLKRMK